MNKSQIFLIGFMASGKSTVGPLLAASIDREFIDLDQIIIKREGCSIAELIVREGEDRFREIESAVLREVAQSGSAVIAPGGGAITRPENRATMSKLGVTFWLDAPFELCWKRIENDRVVRPLAPDKDAALTRYRQRLPLYKAGSIWISIGESDSPADVVESIIEKLPPQLKR